MFKIGKNYDKLSHHKETIVNRTANAVENESVNFELFLKNTIDNLEVFFEKRTQNSLTYNYMLMAFRTLTFKAWWSVFRDYHLSQHPENFARLCMILPFVTEDFKNPSVKRYLVYANYLRFFKRNNKNILRDMKFPHCIQIGNEEIIAIYYRVVLKKPKHLEKFRGDWPIKRKYVILTKKKYEKLYLENRDVYKVLIYEEVKKRSLSYYTEFFGEREREFNIAYSRQAQESPCYFSGYLPPMTGIC